MTEDQFRELLTWIVSVGLPGLGVGLWRIWVRQNKNKADIKTQGKALDAVGEDVGKFEGKVNNQLVELSVSLKRQFELDIQNLLEKIETIETALAQEKTKNETLIRQMNADREMYQSQLQEKERLLQEQIGITNRLNRQIEEERKAFTDMGARYGALEDRLDGMERDMIERNAVIKTYDSILARAKIMEATPRELLNRETTETSIAGETE